MVKSHKARSNRPGVRMPPSVSIITFRIGISFSFTPSSTGSNALKNVLKILQLDFAVLEFDGRSFAVRASLARACRPYWQYILPTRIDLAPRRLRSKPPSFRRGPFFSTTSPVAPSFLEEQKSRVRSHGIGEWRFVMGDWVLAHLCFQHVPRISRHRRMRAPLHRGPAFLGDQKPESARPASRIPALRVPDRVFSSTSPDAPSFLEEQVSGVRS